MVTSRPGFHKARKQWYGKSWHGFAHAQRQEVFCGVRYVRERGNIRQISPDCGCRFIHTYGGGKEAPAALCRCCAIPGERLAGFAQARLDGPAQ